MNDENRIESVLKTDQVLLLKCTKSLKYIRTRNVRNTKKWRNKQNSKL